MTNLPVKRGIDGLPTASIPADPADFVDWFKNSFIPRWASNADIRNATAGQNVQIGGTTDTPGSISVDAGVTSITTGPGITESSSSGNVNLQIADTGVTPGSYTSANITVNAQGQLTAASDGGAALFNVTPDLHPSLPAGVGLGPNDEFETGTVIDTAGTRYPGATPWSSFNIGTGVTSIRQGSLLYTPQAGIGIQYSGYIQPAPASGDWTYLMKIAAGATNTQTVLGLLLTTAAGVAGSLYVIGVTSSSAITPQRASNASTFAINSPQAIFVGSLTESANAASASDWLYYKVSFNVASTIYSVSVSKTGTDGTFVNVLSDLLINFLGTAVTGIGIGTQNQTGNGVVSCDFFRRIA